MDGYERREVYLRAPWLAKEAAKLLAYVRQQVINADQARWQWEVERPEADFIGYARQTWHRKPPLPPELGKGGASR